MTERLTDCKECGAILSLKRVPSSFQFLNKYSKPDTPQPGQVVKKHIEEAKDSIREQKKEMSEEYKS
jgi:hypothetical protein